MNGGEGRVARNGSAGTIVEQIMENGDRISTSCTGRAAVRMVAQGSKCLDYCQSCDSGSAGVSAGLAGAVWTMDSVQ